MAHSRLLHVGASRGEQRAAHPRAPSTPLSRLTTTVADAAAPPVATTTVAFASLAFAAPAHVLLDVASATM